MRGVVFLLIACLLRAYVPFTVLGAAPDAFPCAGHACCCASAEHCASACCCVQRARVSIDRPLEWSKPSSRDSTRVLQSSRCGGGLPNAAMVTFTGILAVLPKPVRIAEAPREPARFEIERVRPHATRRPSPEAPPPRPSHES